MCKSWWSSYRTSSNSVVSRFQSSLLMSFPARVIWCLAAHFGIFHLHAEQSPVSAHAELVPLQTFIKIHVSCRVRDACGVEHDWPIQDDAVFLQRKKTASIRYPGRFIFNRFTLYLRSYPHLQPWARCPRPFWTLQSGPWCWPPRFHEWWPCCLLWCSGQTLHCWWSTTRDNNTLL